MATSGGRVSDLSRAHDNVIARRSNRTSEDVLSRPALKRPRGLRRERVLNLRGDDAEAAANLLRLRVRSVKALSIYVALTALTLAVFALWPGIDLTVAHVFYREGSFEGEGLPAQLLRRFFSDTPFVVLAAYAGLWLARRKGWSVRWAPSGKAVIFLIATMIAGPGLIVNLGLKDHWHRPRPYQTQDFKGPNEFRPWYETDGGCDKNCSFVSGEASTGFWMVAPASLLPPPVRGPAIVGAFVFGIATSILRMAFGGHYLSDVILGGLVTLIVVEIARKLIWPRGMPPDEEAQVSDRQKQARASRPSTARS